MSFIYLVHATTTRLYKIGFATDPKKRIGNLQTSCPFKIELLATRHGSVRDEKFLHVKLKEFRRQGEWFEFGSNSQALSRFTGERKHRTPEEIREALAQRRRVKITRLALHTHTETYRRHLPIPPSVMGLKKWTVKEGDMWHFIAEKAIEQNKRPNYMEIARFLVHQVDGSEYIPRAPLLL